MPMVPFHSRCPDVARREIRSLTVLPGAGSPPTEEYAFLEWYCDDPKCDCRRAFIQILASSRPGVILASLNIGWENEEFYHKQFPYMPEAAREITEGSLDPINEQSDEAPALLKLFQDHVASAAYRARLKQHYELFRRTRPGPLTK